MTLFDLAWRTLLRRPVRSVLTIIGVALASASLCSLLGFSRGYAEALKRDFARAGIHLFVSTEGCAMEAATLALHGGEVPKFLAQERAAEVRRIPGVRVATEILVFALPAEGGRLQMFYGIDNEWRALKPHLKISGEWFPRADSIVLGAEAAEVLQRRIGDRIAFPDLDRDFVVSGVLARTGGEEDGFLYLPLPVAQHVFRKEGKLTGVGVALADIEQLPAVKGRIEALPDVYVVTSEQMLQQILKMVGSSRVLMAAVLAVAVAVAVLGVLNTMLMSVTEQAREFGFFRCVGASRGQLLILILLETTILAAAGGLLGACGGAVASSWMDRGLRGTLPFAPSGSMIAITLDIIFLVALGAMVLGAVAGLYPAWRAASTVPAEALRHE